MPSTDQVIATALNAQRDEQFQQCAAYVNLTQSSRASVDHELPLLRTVFSQYTGRGWDYAPLVMEAALTYGHSPALLWGIMQQESRFDPKAISPSGAYGLMQIHKNKYTQAWFDEVGENWKDPRTNIMKGAEILAQKYRFMKGTGRLRILGSLPDPRPLSGPALTRAALAAYNAGEANVIVAVAKGQDPDVVTDPPRNYSMSVLRRVGGVSERLLAAGSVFGSSASVLASVLTAPVSDPAVKAVHKKGYDIIARHQAAQARAGAPRQFFYTAASGNKVGQGVATQVAVAQIAQATNVASLKNPGFVEDENYVFSTYDYETGKWGDGKPT